MKPLILVVDDNELNREMAGDVLEELGAEPDYAESGSRAIDMISTKTYDCILMDYMMPELDGAKTCEKLRTINDYKNVPVIAMTAEEDPDTIQLLIATGMNAILHKPIEPISLYSTLREFIDYEFVRPVTSTSTDDEFADLEAMGFDTLAGVKYTGSVDLYKRYLTDIISLLPGILNTLNKAEAENDFERFTIEVHGLKSNFRALGHTDLFTRSQMLEKLGKAGETDKIKQLYPEFYTDCQECLERLLKKMEPQKLLPSLSPKAIRNVLLELRDAMQTFDLDTADYIHDRLKLHEPYANLKREFSSLYDDIAGINYEGAVDKIEAILENLMEK